MIIKNVTDQFGMNQVITFLNNDKNHEQIADSIALGIQEEIIKAKKDRDVTSPTQDRFSNIDIYYSVEKNEIFTFNANFSVNYWLEKKDLLFDYDNFLKLITIELSKKRYSKTFSDAFYNSDNIEAVKEFVKKIIFKDFFLKVSESLLSISNEPQFKDFMLDRFKKKQLPFRFICDKNGFFEKLTQWSNKHILKELLKEKMLFPDSKKKFENLRLNYVNNRCLESKKNTDIEHYLKVLNKLNDNNLIINLEIILLLNQAFNDETLLKRNYYKLSLSADGEFYNLLRSIDLKSINKELDKNIIYELKTFAFFLIQYNLNSYYNYSIALEEITSKILNSFNQIGLNLDEKLVLESHNFSSFFKSKVSDAAIPLFKNVEINLSSKDLYYFLKISNELNFDTEGLKSLFDCKSISFKKDFLENCKKFGDSLSSDFVFCKDDNQLKKNIEYFYNKFSKN